MKYRVQIKPGTKNWKLFQAEKKINVNISIWSKCIRNSRPSTMIYYKVIISFQFDIDQLYYLYSCTEHYYYYYLTNISRCSSRISYFILLVRNLSNTILCTVYILRNKITIFLYIIIKVKRIRNKESSGIWFSLRQCHVNFPIKQRPSTWTCWLREILLSTW